MIYFEENIYFVVLIQIGAPQRSNWVVQPNEKAQYDVMFKKADTDNDGLVSGMLRITMILLSWIIPGLPGRTLSSHGFVPFKTWWIVIGQFFRWMLLQIFKCYFRVFLLFVPLKKFHIVLLVPSETIRVEIGSAFDLDCKL